MVYYYKFIMVNTHAIRTESVNILSYFAFTQIIQAL